MKKVLVFSPVCPLPPHDGFRIAIESDLRLVTSVGWGVSLLYFELEAPCPKVEGGYDSVIPIVAKRGGRVWRSLRSVFTKWPASIERYYSGLIEGQILEAIRRVKPQIVIVEDVTLAGFMACIRREHPSIRLVLRTHNVMADAAEAFGVGRSSLYRMMARVESLKWKRAERVAIDQADQVLAISVSDEARLHALYRCERKVLVLPLLLALTCYRNIRGRHGSLVKFGHVGTIDLRRSESLRLFVDRAWPAIRSCEPGALLKLAGKNTAGVRLSGEGVLELGPVADDLEFIESCDAILNPQRTLGGIKLKSVIAMAAGRVLISTPQGVEGLDVIPGIHYLDLDSFVLNAAAGRLPTPEVIQEIVTNARQFAFDVFEYSAERARQLCIELFKIDDRLQD